MAKKSVTVKVGRKQSKVAPTASGTGSVYAFPSKSRCPRCGVENTKAYGTNAGVQYRECLAPVCKWSYKVTGSLI